MAGIIMSNTKQSRSIRWLTATAGLATIMVANAAAAQSDPPAASSAASSLDEVSGEIIVTANKREENLNRVGLTITAISGDALAERQITSLQDVAAIVPGLAFAPSANNTPILTLRGIGFNESSLGVYPAVSVYVDQAPLPFPVLASHAGFDLERIEILKGPQGTLFGANSTGGAINYIAAKPTSSFEVGGDVGYGRFNRLEANAHISGPLSPTMRARVAVSGVNSDGYQVSYTRPYDRNGKVSYIAGRALLDWDPTSAVRMSFSLNAWRDRSEPLAGQYILLQPQTPGDEQPQELAAPFSPETPRAADWAPGINAPRSNRRFIQPGLRAEIDLADSLTLTSLTSYNRYDQTQTTDGDGSALIVTDIQENDGRIRSFNQEIRLANGSSGSFRWVLGANYERSKTFERQLLVYPDNNSFSPSKNFIFQNYQQGRQSIRNYAGFGNVEFDVVEQITLKAAARYTKSRNRAEICGFRRWRRADRWFVQLPRHAFQRSWDIHTGFFNRHVRQQLFFSGAAGLPHRRSVHGDAGRGQRILARRGRLSGIRYDIVLCQRIARLQGGQLPNPRSRYNDAVRARNAGIGYSLRSRL